MRSGGGGGVGGGDGGGESGCGVEYGDGNVMVLGGCLLG